MRIYIWKILLKIRDSGLYWLLRKIFIKEQYTNGEFILDGYPRSGNSIASFFLSELGYHNFIHHTHSPYILNRALRDRKKAIILLRNPKDCISSYILRNNVSSERAILEYINFYSLVYSYREQIILWRFDDLINGIIPGRLEDGGFFFFDSFKKAKLRLEKNEKKNGLNFLQIALPTRGKDQRKRELLRSYIDSKEFKKCEELYNNLNDEN